MVTALVVCSPLTAAAQAVLPSVYLEELTSAELRTAVDQGSTTILIPIGGTEQSGPHMALGKHNVRVKALAGQIAQRLGKAIVAPVLAYVPEGAITPPQAHMRFSGTLSIGEPAFEAVLEATARSLKQHGFRHIVFLGDHGGYQKNLMRVAQSLNRQWASDGRFHALALGAYYGAAQGAFARALRSQGYSEAEIGTHAGLADTALMLAIDPSQVRMQALAQAAQSAPANGVAGDPRKASPALGQIGVRLIVEDSVHAIQQALKPSASP